jgi:NitT/TauT family transport system ATP-binding protein
VTNEPFPADAQASAGAISIRGLSKTFGALKVLNEVNCSIDEAEFVSILGPSGCGKSTILRIIAGLIAPDEGADIRLFGQPLARHNDDVGVVFQTHNMLPWLTVEKNIRLNCEIRGVPRAEIARRVDEILPVLKLDGFREKSPHQISGGMKQRAALGQTLIAQPKVLLLDEPFGALDALTRDQLNVELLRLWQKIRKTVVLITHSISEAIFLSDRVLVMSDRPSGIISDVRIDLPRPRDPKTTREDPRFGQYVTQLSALMGVH